MGNETIESEIEWVTTDSTFQWNYCYEDGPFGQPDCRSEGPIFKYTLNENSLVLFLHFGMYLDHQNMQGLFFL